MNQKQRILNSNAPLWVSTSGQGYKGEQPGGTLVRVNLADLAPKERIKARPLPPVWYAPRMD